MERETRLDEEQVIVSLSGAALHITLNRPGAINSLTLDIVRAISGALERARRDAGVKCVVMTGAGDRGFCAGGDIKIMAGAVRDGSIEPAMQFLREENDLDLLIHLFEKPVVVFAHGITMGGGLGIAAGADIVVATETTRMAMPETRIGFFPDVGSTGWLFSKCGPGYPEFLGLTGYEMAGAECVRVGLASCLIPSSRLNGALQAVIDRADGLPADRTEAASALRQALSPFVQADIPENPEMDRWAREYFAGRTSVLDILSDLKACSILNDLCEGVFGRLSERSPSAVVVTLKCLRRDEGRDLREVYLSDLKVARFLMTRHDFREGVRARLIDRDNRPAWDPDSFEKAAALEPLMDIG
ncbi:MAG TPA: enoyl-CoA hydratase/isomerase family protein [Deltaproteobacteria bacterium]|nr:enoyl-CoA hydratase/isomerase family protein [Deltaproteobacteria bacterium]